MTKRIELIPAIDIIGGQCVRLTKGNYDKKTVYSNDPVEIARHFESLGFKRLHVVDLDGAKSHHIVNTATLKAICHSTSLKIDFGGGIKTIGDASQAFNAGASFITVGSVAVTQPDVFAEWITQFGPEKIILGADVANGKIAINGWYENGDVTLANFLTHYTRLGISQVLCTDVSKDGTLAGPNVALYKSIMEHFPTLHLIASGGVSGNHDIDVLEQAGIPAVVFGKAFYEGKMDVKQLMHQ